MKRMLSVLLVLVLVLLCGSLATAEQGKFDHTTLSELEGYEYDKFDKMWTYSGHYIKKYSDATVRLSLSAIGDNENVLMVSLGTKAVKTNGESYSVVSEVQFLTDDALVTCEMMPVEGEQYAIITLSDVEMLKIISEADSISIRIKMGAGTITLEPTNEELQEFIQVATTICEKNLIAYSTNLGYDESSMELVKAMYPITIEKFE